MDLWSVARAVGGGIVSSVVPGGPAIISAVNGMLPPDKSLSEDATGDDIVAAANALPPDQRAKLYELKFDVQIEQIKQSAETQRAMLAAEANSTHTTRPYIAKGSFQVVATCSLLLVSVWVIAAIKSDTKMLEVIGDNWPFVLAILTPFVSLLYAYFGILKTEQRQKLNAINNTRTTGIGSAIGAIINAVRR